MNEDNSTNKGMGSPSSESVSSSSQNPSSQGSFSTKKPQRPRKWLIIAGILVVLGIAGAAIWALDQGSKTAEKENEPANQPAFAAVCDRSIIQGAGKPITDNDIAALQPIAEGILQKKNYKGDVNCNYILMRYYLMIGDVANSKNTLDDLTYTYGRYGGYSTTFDPPAISPADLKDALDVMVANNQAEQKQNDELDRLDP